MDRVEEGRDSWRDAAEKGRKWGANIFAVAEAAGPFGAVIPVFGVATAGLLPARLRGPQAPRGSGDWTVQRMPGFLLGTRILVSFLDQWQQRIRGLSRGWMYSKPGKGISGWEWKAAQEPTAPRRWTTALRRSAVRFGLWAIDATPLLTSSTGPGYLTQHPGSQDTASLNFDFSSYHRHRQTFPPRPWTWEKKRSMLLPMPRARRRYAAHGAKTFDLRSPMFLFGP
ncbi:hypothetical protein CTAM01_04640 [Colletotrichum tamarilloi]|uniref:Uncharacterized protein n=1 Tax=Colletotrichum tamarilloi TaxID=1209934 RepID=A0ABQ9RGT9_9PEZI|nr:uncharacterized protein CTAM01_04640 [Colletotrichum tamarilloi]KAK1503328.1 hypothetical protein CTAM01_04640 [Colletotrichum tamarilloi]